MSGVQQQSAARGKNWWLEAGINGLNKNRWLTQEIGGGLKKDRPC